jgi:hypothetical protein
MTEIKLTNKGLKATFDNINQLCLEDVEKIETMILNRKAFLLSEKEYYEDTLK